MFVNRSGFQNISFFEGVGVLFPERLCLNLIPIVNQTMLIKKRYVKPMSLE